MIWIIALCGCRGDAPSEDATGAEEPYREGQIHHAGERLEVVPFIAHTREMDLRDQCRTAAAAADGGGDPTPLCFDPDRRSEFTRVRVEYLPGLRGGQAMGLLSADRDAAHFLVEKSGAVTQILDLAYAPRRDGAIRPDEVRILSGRQEGHERLIEALKEHFPDLEVEVVRPVEDDAAGDDDAGPTGKP